MSDTIPPETETLVQVLAAVDSLFSAMPCPRDYNPACFEIFHRRQDYLAGRGLPWTIGGSAPARRVGEQLLASLEKSGLATRLKVARGHRRVQLTIAADDRARSLLGFYRAADAWNLLRGVAEGVANRHGRGPTGPGIWLVERQLCEALDGTPDELRAMLLPLLARGLLSESIATDSECHFTITPKGVEAAAGSPPELAADPEPDERCNPIYWAAYDAAGREKLNWKPRVENSCFVSFPART